MITVLVVVSGLVLFVPDEPKAITALLLDTSDAPAASSHGIAHIPALRQPLDLASAITWPIEKNGDFHVLLQVPSGTPIKLGAKKQFPNLSELTTKVNNMVRSDCVKGTCSDAQGRNLVAADVRFEGAWEARPLRRCAKHWKRPVGFDENAKSDFRKISEPTKAKPGAGPDYIATALGLEARISKLEDLHFQIKTAGGTVLLTPKLELSRPETCREWLPSGDPVCIVLEVEDWEAAAAGIKPPCTEFDTRSECRIDPHFALFYDLLVNPEPPDRWLPFVAEGSLACFTGLDNLPAVRCPPTFCHQ